MSKHTPGPWRWELRYCGLRGPDGRSVLVTDGMGIPDYSPESEANARLIAAAPELLDLVKAFIDQMEAALEGMSHPVHGRFIRGVTNCEIRSDSKLTLDDARAVVAKAEGRS